MDPSDSQTQSGEGSRETSEVFDSVFDFLMDFADKAETTVRQPKSTALVDDDTANEVHEEEEEEEPSEDGGDGNARELFDKFTVREKETLLMEAVGKIVGNMLDKLPEDGKEPFLARCYDGLLPKLPRESGGPIAFKVESLGPVPYRAKVSRPPTLGQQPQQPPHGTGPRHPPPGTGPGPRQPHLQPHPGPRHPPPGTGPGPQQPHLQPHPGPRHPPPGTGPGPRQPHPGPRQPHPGTGPQQPPPGPTA